jgi:hypothetical protein
VLQEKLKADRRVRRLQIWEQYGTQNAEDFGSSSAKERLQAKRPATSFLYFFTRLCGVLHPQLPESATDFLCHHVLERVLALKNTSGSNGDKRKFPLGTIEQTNASLQSAKNGNAPSL